MKCIVSYDLHKVKNYQPLYDLLKQWKAARLLESLWLVELNSSAGAIRDAVKAKLDGDDSVAVIEIKPGSHWGTSNAKPAGVEWLKGFVSA